jgi:hypothetical protein
MQKNNLLKKLVTSFKNYGVLQTIFKVIKFPLNRSKHKHFQKNVLSKNSVEDKFTFIYQKNHWGSKESVSGSGSTLLYTDNLRKNLPGLISKYSIKKVFDAPCGDFNWMQVLLPNVDIDYVGGDIVKALVDQHNIKHKTNKIAFVHLDLIKDNLPKTDLLICRDCLFHLSYKDTKSVLENFVKSGTPYLLTTTHKNNGADRFVNSDIQTGDFRLIDLLSIPYNFPTDYLESIDDWITPDPERQMCLWNRDQILEALFKCEL